MRKLLFLLLLPILLLAKSVEKSCPDGLVTFDYSGDVNKETYFPEYFQGRYRPLFPKNFTCDFQINVPEGTFARITLAVYGLPKDYQGQAPVQMNDKILGVEEVYSVKYRVYYFIEDIGRIKLKTGQNDIHFGFSVRYDEFPSLNETPIDIRVSYSDPVPQIYHGHTQFYPILVTAETRVSASVIRSHNDDDLRSLLFFDGPNRKSKLIGTAYTLKMNKTQFVSTGNTMTIFSMYLGGFTQFIALQDYQITKDIVEFQGIYCRRGEDCGDFVLDGTNGSAVLQSYNPLRYLRSQVMEIITKLEGDGKLDVHIGGRMRNGKNLIASYSPKTTKPILPQLFPGELKTFVVTGGKIKIHLSQHLWAFRNQTIGGKGFISSFDYGHTSKNQDAYSEILAPEKAIIRIKIRDIDLSGSTKLILTGYRDESLVYLETLDYSKTGLSAGEAFNTTND